MHKIYEGGGRGKKSFSRELPDFVHAINVKHDHNLVLGRSAGPHSLS